MNGEDIERLGERLDKLSEGQSQMQAGFAALDATLKTSLDRHASEIAVLFAKHNEHARRIGAIEQSYVPKPDCQQAQRDNRQDHAEFREGITRQGLGGAKIYGAAMAIAVVAGLLAGAVVKLVQ